MKKVLFAISLICSCECLCQIPNIKFGINDLIESAVADGIFIVRTDYVLREKSTGNLFGRGGKQFYGSYYTIGYALPDGIVCDKYAQTPWVKDKDYDKYRDNEQYEPILVDSAFIRKIRKGRGFQAMQIARPNIIKNTCWELFSSNLSKEEVFQINTNDFSKQTGWIVWFTSSSEEILGYNTQLTITSTNKIIDITDSVKIKIESPVYSERIVGGIFVIPKYEGVGSIRLYLKGLISKEQNQWFMYPVNNNWQLDAIEEMENSPTNVGIDELTPVKEKTASKKKKKIKRLS